MDWTDNIPPYCLPIIACCVGGARARAFKFVLEVLVFGRKLGNGSYRTTKKLVKGMLLSSKSHPSKHEMRG